MVAFSFWTSSWTDSCEDAILLMDHGKVILMDTSSTVLKSKVLSRKRHTKRPQHHAAIVTTTLGYSCSQLPNKRKKIKTMFYLLTCVTHFSLWLCGIRHIVKDDSDNKRGKPSYMGCSFNKPR